MPVASITCDSRRVIPGTLFFALKGGKADGVAFIEQAYNAGAVAVVCAMDASVPDTLLPLIRVENPRLALAHMAAAFYNGHPKHMVAVTGTDGKTSTADFFRQFWHGMDRSSASIGTLGILTGEGETLYPGSHTTPDPVDLHKMLTDMAARRIDYVSMEASSHGLDQYRLDGVLLDAAAFTNFTRDHLDYHQTEEAYFKAKERLFSEVLPEGRTVVLNQDDARFSTLKSLCEKRRQKIIGFGRQGAQMRMDALAPHAHGQTAWLELYGQRHELEVPLVGSFQVMNILAALGLVLGVGGSLDEALTIIPGLRGVPGRLEQVASLANGATVFIDYAHTPMALANILRTLRPHTRNRLHVVFGCGGDRDKGKRPEMGKHAVELADVAVVTDDNPRSEDPAQIRREIMATASQGKNGGAKEVADRREAIYVALKGLEAGDVLVIAGKGHEKTQIIGKQTHPFDDAQVTRELVKELKLAA